MSWESLKKLLPNSIKKAGLYDQITGQSVIDIAVRVLLARWGDKKASFVVFVSYQEGKLKAEVSSPVAMQALNVEKNILINAINHELHKKIIKEIVIRRKGF